MALMSGFRIYHHTEKVGGREVTPWKELGSPAFKEAFILVRKKPSVDKGAS